MNQPTSIPPSVSSRDEIVAKQNRPAQRKQKCADRLVCVNNNSLCDTVTGKSGLLYLNSGLDYLSVQCIDLCTLLSLFTGIHKNIICCQSRMETKKNETERIIDSNS